MRVSVHRPAICLALWPGGPGTVLWAGSAPVSAFRNRVLAVCSGSLCCSGPGCAELLEAYLGPHRRCLGSCCLGEGRAGPRAHVLLRLASQWTSALWGLAGPVSRPPTSSLTVDPWRWCTAGAGRPPGYKAVSPALCPGRCVQAVVCPGSVSGLPVPASLPSLSSSSLHSPARSRSHRAPSTSGPFWFRVCAGLCGCGRGPSPLFCPVLLPGCRVQGLPCRAGTP